MRRWGIEGRGEGEREGGRIYASNLERGRESGEYKHNVASFEVGRRYRHIFQALALQ